MRMLDGRPSKPGRAGAEVQLMLLAAEVVVQPATVPVRPTQHAVLQSPGIPVIKLPLSAMAPPMVLFVGLFPLEENIIYRHTRSKIQLQLMYPVGFHPPDVHRKPSLVISSLETMILLASLCPELLPRQFQSKDTPSISSWCLDIVRSELTMSTVEFTMS